MAAMASQSQLTTGSLFPAADSFKVPGCEPSCSLQSYNPLQREWINKAETTTVKSDCLGARRSAGLVPLFTTASFFHGFLTPFTPSSHHYIHGRLRMVYITA